MSTPLDAAQFGPGDVASPSPVDASPQGISDAAGPTPDTQSLPLNGGQPTETNPTAEAQPPAPQKPSMWKNVLRGALAGLEMDGGIGAAIGAVDPDMAQNARANKIALQNNAQYFSSLQSAHEYLNNSILQHQMSQWPTQLQEQKAKIDTPIATAREKNGWRPVAFGQGTGDQAMMAIHKQLLQMYPKGIPDGMQYLWTSSGVAAYDPQRAGMAAVMDDGNLRRVATGQAPLSVSDLSDKSVMTPKVKSDFLSGTGQFWSPVVKGNTAVARYNAARSLVAQYQGYDALNQKLPADTPQRDTAHARMQDTLAHIKMQQDQAEQDIKKENDMKEQLAERSANARGKSIGMWRTKDVIDPQSGQAKTVWAFQAVNSGAAPLNEGAKLMAKGAQLSDIARGSQNMREDVQKLQTPFSDAQLVYLNAAMRQTDENGVKQIVDANLGPQSLSPDQEQYVTDLLNLHERAMSLRTVAGIGQNGSDSVRQAIIAMLPQAKDTPDLMNRKLDRFDQQISILGRGIPSVKGGIKPGQDTGRAPAAGGRITVAAPNGKQYHFADQAAADHFKHIAGIK